MNLEEIKERRLIALKKCNSDRLLVAPARKQSDLNLPSEQTVAAYLIAALRQGFTIEQFLAETGWSKPRMMANLYKVAKKTGVGIERRDGKLQIVWPKSDAHSSEEDFFAKSVVCDEHASFVAA